MFLILIFLIISAFFSSSETSLFSIPWWKLHKFRHHENPSAQRLYKMMSDPHRILVTILFGNTLVNVAASSLAEHYLERHFPGNGLWLAIVVMTIILIVAGEITPKTFAIYDPEKLALKIAGPIDWIARILGPVRSFLEMIVRFASNLSGTGSGLLKPLVRKDLLNLIIEGQREGIISKTESHVVKKILNMEEITLDKIMIPRTQIVALPENVSVEEASDLFRQTHLRRVPLFKDSLDSIVGILYAKDLLAEKYRVSSMKTPKQIARTPYFVPQFSNLKQIYKQLRQEQLHLAIVLDEYGGTAGLISHEDILTALLGPVTYQADPLSEDIQQLSETEFLISGLTDLEEIQRIFLINLGTEDFRTLNGLLVDYFGKIPEVGKVFKFESGEIRVEQVSKQRIEEVKLVLKSHGMQDHYE